MSVSTPRGHSPRLFAACAAFALLCAGLAPASVLADAPPLPDAATCRAANYPCPKGCYQGPSSCSGGKSTGDIICAEAGYSCVHQLTGTPPGERIVVSDTVEPVDIGIDDVDDCKPGQCCPPTTTKKIIMGLGSIVSFLVLFFLMVRLMERAFIRQEKSPLMGRHLGISLALFLGGGAVCGIFFAVTECWYPSYTYWAAFLGIVWLLHLIYTMVAIRK